MAHVSLIFHVNHKQPQRDFNIPFKPKYVLRTPSPSFATNFPPQKWNEQTRKNNGTYFWNIRCTLAKCLITSRSWNWFYQRKVGAKLWWFQHWISIIWNKRNVASVARRKTSASNSCYWNCTNARILHESRRFGALDNYWLRLFLLLFQSFGLEMNWRCFGMRGKQKRSFRPQDLWPLRWSVKKRSTSKINGSHSKRTIVKREQKFK